MNKKKYILDKNTALRSWRLIPHAYYRRYSVYARKLEKNEFELLKKCDGITELEESELLKSLCERGFCEPAKDGDTLSEWQKHLDCDNRYVPRINWMITGKCNYNCLHCYCAADNAPSANEFTMEEALRLINEARECGVNEITLTGGEPMAHPQFFDIAEEIVKQGMYIGKINTNGHFIDQTALERLSRLGYKPGMALSFDGIGFHDWMRARVGAEQDALRSIRLCVENGFSTQIHVNFNRKNEKSVLPTLELLDSMGVEKARLLMTTPAPRWEKNADGQTFEFTEYYGKCFEIIEEYTQKKHKMRIDFWQFANLRPLNGGYALSPITDDESGYRDSLPVCKGTRGRAAITAKGEILPCIQMSGGAEAVGLSFGNVKRDGLKNLLRESEYMTEICKTVKDLTDKNEKCRNCEHLKKCHGGCRMLAMYTTGVKAFGPDLTKCIFFEKGYYDRVTETDKKLRPRA